MIFFLTDGIIKILLYHNLLELKNNAGNYKFKLLQNFLYGKRDPQHWEKDDKTTCDHHT